MFVWSKRNSGLEIILDRPRPGAWQQFFERPYHFLARLIYTWRRVKPAEPLVNPVSIVCISDTHNSQPTLPDGDVLIHAGDLTQSGTFEELQRAISWISAQPHPFKVVIAGNHDFLLDVNWRGRSCSYNDDKACTRDMLEWGDIIYLENSESTITCASGRQLRIYGSPYSARHGSWAFQYPRSENVWEGTISEKVDILVTHGPPRGHLDLLTLGCPHLLREVWRVRPKLHVFGHIHEGAGTEWLSFDLLQNAYEQTIIANGGFKNLLWTIKAFLQSLHLPVREAKCLLVNPSMVGGLRDDDRRRPVKIIL